MNKKSLALVLTLVLAPAIAAAQAQITTGIIDGTVLDQSGAVVPGAEVEARNENTNFTRTVFTEGDGSFLFLQMPSGPYTVTYRLTGFATLVQDGLVLTVGQRLTLRPTLSISGTEEIITVTGSDIVDTGATPSSTTMNELTIQTTPVLGRKFEDLLTLTPGVAIVQGPDGDSITFAGQRGIYNNISLDGGDYNNGFFGEQVGGQRAAIDITLEAVQEFQVVAAGANAEFGRTGGGVVNVITKSGTNETHGSLFWYQRHESMTGDLSDGSRLEDFHREQFGGTIGGPIKKDKLFFFGAVEGITGDFTRPNLSVPIGEPCPISNPTIPADEALIGSSPDCQRVALLNYYQDNFNQDEGRPVPHPVETVAALAKIDWVINDTNNLALSYNFAHSRKENETFDVATYGNSANAIEGNPMRIHTLNLNLFTTLSPTTLNEFHFTFARETRPRTAVESNVNADTGIGFAPSFRFGNPFFTQPNIDELFWRTQVRNNFTLVRGNHTIKLGGEWIHSLNNQTFRGFFTARYLFLSVPGFLRYASPPAPGGFGPSTKGCSDGSYVTHPATCPAGSSPTGGPLLFNLTNAGTGKPGVPPPGRAIQHNDEFGIFLQDTWKVTPAFTLNYGLRWDAQTMSDTPDPSTTNYAEFIGDPRFPSDGTIPDQWNMWQPRIGFAWDVSGDAKTVVRGNFGIYYARLNMLSQVTAVTDNGLQQRGIFRNTGFLDFGLPLFTYPNAAEVPPLGPDEFDDFVAIHVFDRDYKNPKTTTFNIAIEQEIVPDWAAYVDFIYAEGDNLTRFRQFNNEEPICCVPGPGPDGEPGPSGNRFGYASVPFGPRLANTSWVHDSTGESKYRGVTIGLRKRFSNGFQFDANYVYSKDEDHDSNERDPFVNRNVNFFDIDLDWGLSDRDITHRFNLYAYAEVGPVNLNVRWQVRSAQPITPSPRFLDGVDRGRNTLRKENEFNSFDWRLMWPIRFGSQGQFQLVPIVEMFNTFNSRNFIDPLISNPLFNFDGFVRTGLGDPRQLQLAVRFEF